MHALLQSTTHRQQTPPFLPSTTASLRRSHYVHRVTVGFDDVPILYITADLRRRPILRITASPPSISHNSSKRL
ncbi:hypothetical protein SESBI_11080 [Sesbania bispinosa]|nr:hypothetical protein SESBI_11080 [Sesbania bispinosa]